MFNNYVINYMSILLRVFTFCLLMFFNLFIEAQNVDSLEYAVTNGDTKTQLKSLSDLTMYYQNSNLQKALDYAFQQEKKATDNKEIYWLADAYENIGIIYYFSNNIDSSMYFFVKASNLWTKENNLTKVASTQINISTMYRHKMMYDSALFYLQKALIHFETEKHDEKISQIFANIAAVYNDMKNNEKHDEYSLRALAIQERIGSGASMGITLANLSTSYETQGKFDEAINYGIRAIDVFRKEELPYYLCRSLIRTALPMFHINDDKRGLDYINEALSISEDIDVDFLRCEALRVRAKYYMKTEQWKKAKLDATQALALTDSTNAGDLTLLYQQLLEISIQNNDTEESMYYFKKYQNISEELQEQNWIEKMSEMEIKYKTEQKELKIITLEQKNALILRTSFMGGIILILLLTFFILRHRLAENRRKLAEQTVIQMKQEKELAETKAEYQEEITERTELAIDLNVLLENMLSDLKTGMNDLKTGKNTVKEDVNQFNSMLNMLESSITELRTVANNMMPNSEQAKINRQLFERINIGLKELLETKEIFLKPDIRLDTLAELLATNKSYVSIVINESFNTNFYALLNRYRVKKATELLMDNSLQVKDVWIHSGFNSQSTFNAMFHKEMGVTPNEWKKKI